MVYISEKSIFFCKVCLLLTFQWEFYFIGIHYGWVFDREEFNVWYFSRQLQTLLNSMGFRSFRTTKEEKNAALINRIHHFILLMNQSYILKHISLILFLYYFTNIFARFKYLIYPTPFHYFSFLKFMYIYIYIIVDQDLPTINTKPNLWILAK